MYLFYIGLLCTYMKVITDEKRIDEILTRSIKEILPSKELFKKALMSGERLTIYIGTDATGSSLHLGHATNYMVLERLRQLGHRVIFLIGDFTSRIGDPTDKLSARQPLTREQVVENTQTWLDQVKPLITIDDPENPVEIKYNHDWLSQLNFEDIIDIASQFTVQHMMERDMFQKRIAEEKPIHLHEFFYPLMQGYDSVAMDVDVELCGSDQTFNALAGRHLQKRYHNKEKFVMITTLLENPKTKEKMMSKSLGTGVFLDWSPRDMFGGIMAQPDENMEQLFIDTTYSDLDDIKSLIQGDDKRQVKLRLAFEITEIYHGTDAAQEAQKFWEETFTQKNTPTNIPTVSASQGDMLMDIILAEGLLASKGEIKRLIDQGGLKQLTDNEEVKVDTYDFTVSESCVFKIGKKKFLQVDII